MDNFISRNDSKHAQQLLILCLEKAGNVRMSRVVGGVVHIYNIMLHNALSNADECMHER